MEEKQNREREKYILYPDHDEDVQTKNLFSTYKKRKLFSFYQLI